MTKRLSQNMRIMVMLLVSNVLGVGSVMALTTEPLEQMSVYITDGGEGLADKLAITNERAKYITKKQLLVNFCRETLSHGRFTTTLADAKIITYDPAQSVFLYVVCGSIDSTRQFSETFTDRQESYIKAERGSLDGLNLICDVRTGDDIDEIYQPVGCVPGCETDNMQDCDFSLLMPGVLREVQNDFTNIGLSIAYGMTNVTKKDITDGDFANQFGVRYFTTVLCNREIGSCLFPRTHKRLVTQFKKARRLAKKTTIINSDLMLEKSDTCKNPEMAEDLMSCTYAGNNLMLAPIADLMYNEIYFYELLMAYYKSYLTQNPTIGEFKVGVDRTSNLRKVTEEIERINFESTMHLRAVSTSLRMLMQIYTYYPLHIGLNAYQEYAVTFRNSLAKIYQPLHQLHYKLQNVQAPAES